MPIIQSLSSAAINTIRGRINNALVRQLILDGHITIEQGVNLELNAHFNTLEILQDEGVRQLIIDRHITIEQYMNLNPHSISELENPNIRKLIAARYMSLEQLDNLSPSVAEALKDVGVYQFIIDKHINIEQLGFLGSAAVYTEEAMMFIINHGMLNRFITAYILTDDGVRQFIITGNITIERFNMLSVAAAEALRIDLVRQFIINRHITIRQFTNLDFFAAQAFVKPPLTIPVKSRHQLFTASQKLPRRLVA